MVAKDALQRRRLIRNFNRYLVVDCERKRRLRKEFEGRHWFIEVEWNSSKGLTTNGEIGRKRVADGYAKQSTDEPRERPAASNAARRCIRIALRLVWLRTWTNAKTKSGCSKAIVANTSKAHRSTDLARLMFARNATLRPWCRSSVVDQRVPARSILGRRAAR